MEIYYLSKFARQYKKLAPEIQAMAERKERIFRKDPFDSQLRTHKLSGPLSGFWAFSVTDSYRIIFEFAGDDVVRFYQIGDHNVYRT